MRATSSAVVSLLVLGAVAWLGPAGAARAQPAPGHDIPQSLAYEHEDTLRELASLAQRPGPVGVAATKALDLFKRHTEREQAYILPPLALLPDLADGKATPDMAWALVMIDRVKADREVIFQEHEQVTDLMNELLVAGERSHDREAVDFARSAAADSLNDLEILEPTVLLIGDYLRTRLAAGH